MLCERMARSHNSWRNLRNHPNLDWQLLRLIVLCDWRLRKFSSVDNKPMVKITHTPFLSTNAASLSLILSLSVSPSPLSAWFPDMFYLSQFHLNTWMIQCWLSLISVNWFELQHCFTSRLLTIPQLSWPFFIIKGKTSLIRYLLERDYPGLRIGPEPTTDNFTAVMYGESEQGPML